jgi:multidrug efflux pump subunit AcrA (membrane-fusion protein)
MLVPAESIVREGEETAVFVAAGNKAQRRPVVLGITDKTHAEVKSGVKAGEQVITHGQAGLPDGAAITTKKPGEKAAPAAEKAPVANSNDKPAAPPATK